MGYVGNLSCRDCGLTFTSRWGGGEGVDEYRCPTDHVVDVSSGSGDVLGVEGVAASGDLATLRGMCPVCGEELATGLLPSCPVCGGRDHEVLVQGVFS